MQRKQLEPNEDEDDQWLSTRNKRKISQNNLRPRKRRNIGRPITRQFPMTQNSPPHPQLKLATKQSNILAFFQSPGNTDKLVVRRKIETRPTADTLENAGEEHSERTHAIKYDNSDADTCIRYDDYSEHKDVKCDSLGHANLTYCHSEHTDVNCDNSEHTSSKYDNSEQTNLNYSYSEHTSVNYAKCYTDNDSVWDVDANLPEINTGEDIPNKQHRSERNKKDKGSTAHHQSTFSCHAIRQKQHRLTENNYSKIQESTTDKPRHGPRKIQSTLVLKGVREYDAGHVTGAENGDDVMVNTLHFDFNTEDFTYIPAENRTKSSASVLSNASLQLTSQENFTLEDSYIYGDQGQSTGSDFTLTTQPDVT